MNACRTYMLDNAAGIAREAAATSESDVHVALLEELIREWAHCMDNGGVLQLSELDALEGPGGSARTLRTLEAVCIEALRRNVPGPAFREEAVRLRRCVRRSIMPAQQADPQDKAFYQELLGGPAPIEDPRFGQLLAFFRGVMSSLRNMVFVYDVHGNVLYANDAFLGHLKFTEDDITEGLSVYDFILPEYTDLIETFIDSPGSVMRAPFTVEAYANDAQRVPLELTTEPIVQGDEITALLGLAGDVSLERRLEEEIRRSNAYLDAILTYVPVGIVSIDEQSVVTDANPAAVSLLGAHTDNELAGCRVEDLLDPQDEQALHAIREILGATDVLRCCFQGKTRFGAEVNWDMRVTPLPERAGRRRARLLLLVDLSEQLALQESLFRSEKLKALGLVMAGVAHELNNPLTGILGYAQLALQTGDLASRHADYLDHIRMEAERCKRIVEELQGFSQRRSSRKTACDVNALLGEVVSLCEYQVRIDGIDIRLSLGKDLPPLQADVQALQRVFLNIINNAHEALRPLEAAERRIDIATRVEDGMVHVVFMDNGPGISQEHLAQVIDPFFTTKDVGEGIGMGLSVAYGIIRDHGGDLTVASIPGEGTTVDVSLSAA